MSTMNLGTLQNDFRGRLVEPSDADYDKVRALWNGMFDERPRVIAQCTGTADVQAALKFAREQNLVVAVRGGGHSISGASTVEDGLVIDLSPMNGVRVDPERRVAHVQGGATWASVDREAQVHGLATTGGMISHTGVGGLTLGGGIGRLMRQHGLSCDNVLSFDVVTSDGEALHVNEDTHPDLFWALRGGGGGVVIVTSFEFRVHPIGPIVLGGFMGWPIARAPEVTAAMVPILKDAPPELAVQLIFGTASSDPDLASDELAGQRMFMLSTSWTGSFAEGEAIYDRFRSAVQPSFDDVGRVSYAVLQAMPDVLAPHGRRVYSKSGYFEEMTPELVEAAMRMAERSESPFDFIEFYLMGGAVADVSDEATAFAPRESVFFYSAGANWVESEHDIRQMAWAAALDAEFAPFRTPGRYINFVSETDEDSAIDAMGQRIFERLATVKQRYDPDNIFARNPNTRRRATAVSA